MKPFSPRLPLVVALGLTLSAFVRGESNASGPTDAGRTAPAASAASVPGVPLPLASAYPAPQATGVCPDTPLRLSFDATPTLGAAGKIHVIDEATGQEVDSINLAEAVATKTIGGEPNYRYYPAIIEGRSVTLFPRNGALAYGKKYGVRLDAGVFVVGDRPSAALTDASWTFSTKASAPAAGTTRLTVAADGSGDFCTVQGAIDFVPAGNTTPTTITLKRGTYTEIVFFTNKHALTIIGEDRRECVIAYATNDRFNSTKGNPFGSSNPNPAGARVGGNIYHRGVFLAHRVNDLVLANLTIRNTTPQGGSQAEAIILNGTDSAHAILKDVDLYSYQDTLQINGQAFLTGCYIEGDVDFMWGTGPCFFEKTICRSLRSGAYYTQIRNPESNHGYVYVDCTFDGAQGIMGNYLSRIGTGRFPHSEVVLINCTVTAAVNPVAWQFQGGREGNDHDPAQVHFWEFNSHDAAGKPVETALRLPGSKRMTEPADAATIANYRNPTWVLGNDWNPRAAAIFKPTPPPAAPAAGAPVITAQPGSQLALLGTRTTLRVGVAPGTGAVSYQWRKNGQPIVGATTATLRFDRVGWSDAAVYAVTVSNAAGASATDAARLTPVAPQANPAPQLPVIPDRTYDVTQFGAKPDAQTDNTAAIQRAIDEAVKAGGGTVLIPAATQAYLCGPLTLGSNLELEIATGATLRLLPYAANPGPGAYPLTGDDYANFLTASKAHDIAITGGGTLEGDGEAWWAAFRANKKMPHRPFLIRLNRCERVLLSGITLTRSPMFHAALNADHLTVFGVKVDCPEGPNTDGVDPAGAQQLIQNCWISCGDDNIAIKAGSAPCSDITIADCAFGEGHGLSVGGQSTRGLDRLTVRNCSFEGTTSGLRLKADPTQGGESKNISYTNLSMNDVQYPFVFYSYYNKVGNPGSTSGGNQTTPARAREWNATPPNELTTGTMPSWKNITVSNVLVTNSKGHSILWGLPRAGYFIDSVKLTNVRVVGGPGLKLINATNVQIAGDSDLGPLTVSNALAIARQPQSQSVAPGGKATFSVETAGPNTASGGSLTYQWTADDRPLADGAQPDGTVVSGATSPTLVLDRIAARNPAKYAVIVSTKLDVYDPTAKALQGDALDVTATSHTATLTVAKP